MKTRLYFFSVLFAAALVLISSLVLSCKKGGEAPLPETVAALTGGVIERSGPVKVEFTGEFDTGIPILPAVFRLDPGAKGELSWENSYTLIFYPEVPLEPGRQYAAYVNPESLVKRGQWDGALKAFRFTFETALPKAELVMEPVKITESGMVLVSGKVATDNDSPADKIEKVISAPELGKPSWVHENNEHRFSFPLVTRNPESRTVVINWDRTVLGGKDKGSTSVLIPGSENFEAVGFSMENGVVVVSFSAPIRQDLDLRGFVSLSGNTDIRYSLDGNIIRVYGERGKGDGVSAGSVLTIRDIPAADGRVLARPVQYTVPGKWELPEARFTGSGTILPSSQGSSMVIETRNLSGILVEAFKIHGDNMVQFLQVNNLSGTGQLERVGEPVWTKSFTLPWKDTDKNTWKRQGLDLSELARRYPDGMFHLRLSFRPRHIKYECTAGHSDFSGMQFPDDTFRPFGNHGEEQSNWDWFDNNYNDDWYAFRQDPCHPAFYGRYYDHNITVGRNVLVSDLGLLVKKSLDGSWMAAATNVKTAKVQPGVDIEVLNFQGRTLYTVKTGSDGTALFGNTSPGGSGYNTEPYFLAARSGLGRAYLKIDNATALTVSHFDISGEKPVSGIRGLIYGERGVWRPGDNVYLTFLLSDPMRTLPASHPVSFELEDPRGRISAQKTLTSSVDGFYPFNVSTAPDAPTGDWIARVKVGGSVFTRNVKIETVMPNRLKMDLDFRGAKFFSVPGAEKKPYIERETAVALESSWLYGAPARELRSDITVSFADNIMGFPEYGDYSFRDPSRSVSGERQTVWTGTLDNQGRANFSLALNPGDKVPGKLSARFMTRVFEPSGTFSSEQISMDFSPYNRYVGLKLPRGDAARNMLLTDTDHRADILLLGADGKPINGNVQLECALYKLEWRWWWEKGAGEAAEFASAFSRNPVSTEKVNAVNGRAMWNFQVKAPEWGRYMVVVRDSGGHSAASEVYIDWPGWAGRSTEGQGAAAMLVLSPEKAGYTAGEKVSVSFPSNNDAAALVLIEKGGSILKKEWISCSDTVTRYEFTADPSMVPNVYVHVTLLQPHLQVKNDLPLRLYGITPVMVEDPKTQLSPRITAPANWEPETPVSFTVSEASGRPMAYTVAVVDEGLLGLTKFSLPNPRNTFFAREASFLKSWDIFADFMNAYSGQLETLLAIGGSDGGELDSSKETMRFKPVVQFFGPYELPAGQSKTETFTLPPYIGSLRIMVMAASSSRENRASSSRAYGTAEKAVTVSSDLMVFATVPRTLSPGDEAVIPVSVASYKEGNRQVEVNLSISGAVLSGPARQTVSFNAGGEKTVQFRVRAPDIPGSIKLTVNASSPGLKPARHITELAVRTTALPVTVSQIKLLSAGEAWNGTIAFPGRPGTNNASVEFSRLPPLNLEGRLQYLVAYPHGCVEQTTSAAFPQLYLDKVLSLDDRRLAELRTNVAAAIERLAGFQVPGGGFSYWPGGESAQDWASTYAGHFLIEAKRAGYVVPAALLNQFIAFQKGRTAVWSSGAGNQAEQAYRLYTLALAGEADMGSMNRLREGKNIEPLALWRLAAAYWYAGQRDTARNLVNSLNTRPARSQYRELSGTFGSALRDKAIILETLVLLGDTGRAKALFEEIARELSRDQWLSTQETAYALLALIPYMRGNAGNTSQVNVEASFGKESKSLTFSVPVMQAELGSPQGSSGSFTVRNRSQIPVYARIAVRGLPEEGKEPALSQGMAMTVEYRNDRGIVDPETLSQGEDMDIHVTVRNTSVNALREIALVHSLPASWEIINNRLAGVERQSSFTYQDIRDGKVMTYFDLAQGASITVVVRVNKSYAGIFYRPAVQAYAMYDESIRALIPGVINRGR
ncbi:MAG: alpha-2-macroglobulin [Treponema sp.]|nr:alpha-2-macroglobulin [Treponema sp.]